MKNLHTESREQSALLTYKLLGYRLEALNDEADHGVIHHHEKAALHLAATAANNSQVQ
jgi:hypothetical protein